MRNKIGGLAIISKATVGSNVGKIVTCAEFLGVHEIAYPGRTDVWIIKFQQPTDTHYIRGEESGTRKFLWAHCPDAWLTPVSGIPDEDTTERETKLPNLNVEELA